jgi:hypothetical protein
MMAFVRENYPEAFPLARFAAEAEKGERDVRRELPAA